VTPFATRGSAEFPANLPNIALLLLGSFSTSIQSQEQKMRKISPRRARFALLFAATAISSAPGLSLAQAASPFLTGATALQTNILAWLTPVAIILVMILGGMAMANRMSWGWCIGAIIGIAIAFGAPQIVTWVRGMFGV
jgi:type IV secretion system protein VirB2